MTIPPIGAIGHVLSQSLTGLTPGETAGTPGVGGASTTTGTESSTGVESSTSVESASGGESGGFGEALTQAITSLDKTQQSADGAAQALATGTASNPESAVVTVENAQLAMQLASQIRTKGVEAAQQIFQTQV
jgi:flagellar hook-basal body complex protein FliE